MQGNAQAKAAVSKEITVAQGSHTFSVVASNDQGNGPSVEIDQYIGYDMPKAVTNAQGIYDGEAIAISWDGCIEGVNGGYFEPANVTYKVVRNTDQKVIADGLASTSVVDSDITDEYSIIAYTIIAKHHELESETCVTPTIKTGSYVYAPYSCTVKDKANREFVESFYSQIDANGDGHTFSAIGVYQQNTKNNADDWYVTPAIKLRKGMTYTVKYQVYAMDERYPHIFSVCYGSAPDVEHLNNVLVSEREVANTSSNPLEVEATLVAQEEVTYFAVHLTSPDSRYTFTVGTFSIEQVKGSPSPSIGSLSATAGQNGALSATISCNAPTIDINGDDLTSNLSAEVYNVTADNLVEKAENIAPGESFTVIDNAPAPDQTNIYRLTFSNEAGKGASATSSIFVGTDAPTAPLNVSWSQPDGTDPVITWDAPTEGKTGNYLDPEKITYNIYLNGKSEPIATGVSGNSYTHEGIYDPNRQFAVYYEVRAVNAQGESSLAKTYTRNIGKAYELPVFERFFNRKEYTSWIYEEYGPVLGYWVLTQKSDIGLVALGGEDPDFMMMYNPTEGDDSRLISPTISLKNESDPVLRFKSSKLGANYSICVEISLDNANSWTKIYDVPKMDSDSEAAEWTTNAVDLSQFKNCERVIIAFHAQSEQASTPWVLDNIKICRKANTNLSAHELFAPSDARPGDELTAEVKISNDGSQQASSYKVNLYADDELVATKDVQEAIESDAYKYETINFILPPYITETFTLKAEVITENDEYEQDNCKEAIVKALNDIYPGVENLQGLLTDDGSLSLTWDAPQSGGFRFTETFERFQSWTLAGVDINYDINTGVTLGVVNDEGSFGTFRLIDNDHFTTSWFLNTEINHANQNAPMAGTIMDAYYPLNISYYLQPYGGQKTFAFISSTFGKNDDYLILPELSSDKTISFFAKSGFSNWGDDKIEICVSEAESPTRDSFRVFVRAFEVPYSGEQENNGYTYYTFDLPETTRWAAIHYVTDDCSMTMIDNLSCSPLLKVQGYQIYCNGVLANDGLLSQPSFTGTTAEGDEWTVVPIYEGNIQGQPTQYVYRASSNVIAPAENGIITVDGSTVIVKNIPSEVRIFNANGMMVDARSNGLDAKITIPNAGIYIVNAGNQSMKVYIK